MASRGRPVAADPDNPGRTVSQPPLNRGGPGTPGFAEELTRDGMTAVQLVAESIKSLEAGNLTGAGMSLRAAIDRTEDKPLRVELRAALYRIDWLSRWMGRAGLKAKRAETEKQLEAINQALDVLGG